MASQAAILASERRSSRRAAGLWPRSTSEVEAGIDDKITNQLNPTAIKVEPPASQWGTALQPQEEAGGFRNDVEHDKSRWHKLAVC